MSLERVIEVLVNLGLTRVQAEIYVFTAKKGFRTIEELVEGLNYSGKKIRYNLESLVAKELVTKKGSTFYAISFEEALELLIEQKKKEANHIQESKRQVLSSWEKEK